MKAYDFSWGRQYIKLHMYKNITKQFKTDCTNGLDGLKAMIRVIKNTRIRSDTS